MGRRPINGRKAMTDAQRQQRHRRKARQQKEQALRMAKGAVKRARRDEMEAALAARTEAASDSLAALGRVYGVIYADPPWRWEPWSRITGMDRAADNHSPTMTTEQIATLRVPAAPDCVLFLWATVPMLPQALEVMMAWGFEYRSAYAWVKPGPGLGYWSPPRPARAPAGRHQGRDPGAGSGHPAAAGDDAPARRAQRQTCGVRGDNRVAVSARA